MHPCTIDTATQAACAYLHNWFRTSYASQHLHSLRPCSKQGNEKQWQQCHGTCVCSSIKLPGYLAVCGSARPMHDGLDSAAAVCPPVLVRHHTAAVSGPSACHTVRQRRHLRGALSGCGGCLSRGQGGSWLPPGAACRCTCSCCRHTA